MRKTERVKIISGLKSGEVSIVVGTHALIQKDVDFHKLGLVIIDEQHRFGVNQRSSLLEKGENPHSMAMTATPIPRTLAITYHGDMDISIIDELPSNRLPIVTKVVDPKRLNKVYKFMRDEVSKGRQCIIVYPLIEESEKSDLAAAVEAHAELSKIQFSNLNVGLVHGKMKAEEKDDVIKNFETNQIHILISTTVVEVGIDIPNATVMLVEHAERFGLTQLHQLRGRVGRGENKSYCILVRRNITRTSKNRLLVMEKTNDGFVIADEDLKLRGPGEFFGLRQSGFLQFKIADMVLDGSLLRQARSSAFDLIVQDENLTNSSNKQLREWFISDYHQYLDTIKLSR
jgi:ATP-dependent DNA helicase RecG